MKKGLLFRLGLGGIFLANSATAWFSPDDFKSLLGANRLAASLGHPDALVRLIGLNDALLFLLIAAGKFRKLAVIWGTLWIFGVIFVTGISTPDFIEHIAVILLLLYYFKAQPVSS